MPYYTSDYTRLIHRENKLWSFDTFALPGSGWSIPRLVAAGAAGVVTLGVGGVIAKLTGVAVLWLVALAASVAAAAVMYWMGGRLNADRMSLVHSLIVWFDWTFTQPRKVTGFTKDSEPTTLHWQAITWQPHPPPTSDRSD